MLFCQCTTLQFEYTQDYDIHYLHVDHVAIVDDNHNVDHVAIFDDDLLVDNGAIVDDNHHVDYVAIVNDNHHVDHVAIVDDDQRDGGLVGEGRGHLGPSRRI